MSFKKWMLLVVGLTMALVSLMIIVRSFAITGATSSSLPGDWQPS